MQNWEYLQITMVGDDKSFEYFWEINGKRLGKCNGRWGLNDRPIVEYMNQIGKQGWELVSVSDTPPTLFFKCSMP